MSMQDVYSRLVERGLSTEQVDYVKRLARIGVGVPFWPRYFQKHYGQDKSPKEILSKIEDWEKALDDDFLIDKKTKLEIQRNLVLAKYATYHAILFQLFPVEYAKIRFHFPGIGAKILRIFGLVSKSHKYAKCVEYMEKFIKRVESALDKDLEDFRKGRKRIDSKLFDERRGTTMHGLLFTKFLIPVLYEYLFPFYKTTPHRMGPYDNNREFAYYPEALMRDISDILLTEYPDQPKKLTPEMVKAAISRYLDNQELKQRVKALLKYRLTSSSEDIEKVLKSF